MPLSDFEYSEDVRTIVKVSFGILSPERIKQKAVCEIYKHITSYKNLEGTLMDPRLGPIERGKICPTCRFTYKNCPGHFGYLNLAKPVIQIQYYATIINLLKCFCNRCSSILINVYDTETMSKLKSRKGKGRFIYVLDIATKAKECPNCGATQPKFGKDKDGIAKISMTYPNKTGEGFKGTFNNESVLNIFKRITDEHVELVGLNPLRARPEWMLWTVMPIPPPPMRPSVKSETGKVSDDDLSHKLNDIIKFNNQLRLKLDVPTKQSYIDDWWQLVQYHVATYIDNEISNIPKATHRSGRPLKTLRQRIKAKEGRVRGNLMGKRVDGSARSVITADPNLSIDQLGVPKQIAMNLTYPELVTPYNINQLTQCVRNGPDVFPGAKSYKGRYDERKKNLKYYENRDTIKLEPGDIVYRHLMDNDWVLFNRQPSLHKMSMMAHRVKVLDWKTFRLNVNVTSPYNADFDGDEMNMHVPQTLEAVNELKYLASVPTQIVSPQSSSPVMGLVQDSLLGSYLFSKGAQLTIREMMRLIGWINSYTGKIPLPAIGGQNPLWTSQQMISLLLPAISFSKRNDKNPEASVVIKGGDMSSGLLDKSTLGAKTNSLFHITWNDHGPLPTQDLFNNITRVSKEWLQIHGFSAGISDCVTKDEVLISVKDIIDKYKKAAIFLIEAVSLGNSISEALKKIKQVLEADDENGLSKIEAADLGSSEIDDDPQTIKKDFPGKMISLFNECRGKVEKITQKNLDPNNSINAMVVAGSKGSTINIVQVISMLGQQEVEGSWITEQFNRRTLPHFHKDNLTPEAHGFIESSFMTGLGPAEYWFHAAAGRVGIISKAIKTAETGYIQRKLIKAMEDLRICYDGTVRNANNIIIQTVYGNDGFDALYHEPQKLTFLNYNMVKLQNEFKHLESENLRQRLTETAYSEYIGNQNNKAILESEFKTILEYYHYIKKDVYPITIPQNVRCPINIYRLIQNIVNKFNLDKEVLADIDPIYIVQQVEILRQQIVVDSNKQMNYVSTIILKSLLSTHLSSKNLIYRYKFNKIAFDFLIKTVYITFMKVLVSPGENVGVIAAQSIGEPTTQMSCRHNTMIIVYDLTYKKILNLTVGEFIDNIMKTQPQNVIDIGHGSTILKTSNYLIPSITQQEKIKWSPISEISCHPSNGDLIEVTTKSHRSVTTTKSHSFLKRNESSISPVRGDQLKVGDRIPISKKLPTLDNPFDTINILDYVTLTSAFEVINNEIHHKLSKTKVPQLIPLDKEFGWLIGAYCAQGSTNHNIAFICDINLDYQQNLINYCNKYQLNHFKCDYVGEYGPSMAYSINNSILAKFLANTCGSGAFNKKIPDFVFGSNIELIKGVLRGYMDGDGNVDHLNGLIRAGSRSKTLIEHMCLLFNYVNIFTTQPVEIKTKEPTPFYCLSIATKYVQIYSSEIGSDKKDKIMRLKAILLHEAKLKAEREAKLEAEREAELKAEQEAKLKAENKAESENKNKHNDNTSIDKALLIKPKLKLKVKSEEEKLESNIRKKWDSTKEENDKIPKLGNTIAKIGRILASKGHSRNYGRWVNKESIGRRTLEKYIKEFEEDATEKNMMPKIQTDLDILKQAAESDVVWDKIVHIETINDPLEMVYDFSVPGTESFMLQSGIIVHNTLDTFHSTGIGSKANVSRGVPRIRELMSLTRNPKNPSMVVHIQNSYFDNSNGKMSKTNNHLRAEKLGAEMEYTILEDLLIRTEIYYDENDHKTCLVEDQEFIDSYYDILPTIDQNTDISQSPWLIRMEFNREEIMNKHIALSVIEHHLKKFLKGHDINHSVIISDDNAYKMICRIKIENTNSTQDPISNLRAIEKNLLIIPIKGIEHIDKGLIRTIKKDIVLNDGTIISPFDPEFEEISKDHDHLQYVIDTNGSNLIDVLNLLNVDQYNTISTDVWEIYKIYGIEAARSCLIHEIIEVLDYNGTYISQRHIDLLVDVMTNQGSLVSVDRHGVNKTDSGPLHRLSFEETTTQITNASIFNESDPMTGVSGNIMFGQFIPTGTNAFRLALDMDMIKNKKPPEQVLFKKSNINVVGLQDTSDVCNPDNFQFTFKLNTKLK